MARTAKPRPWSDESLVPDPERHDHAPEAVTCHQREVALQDRALLPEQTWRRLGRARADHPDAPVAEHQRAGETERLVGAPEVARLHRRHGDREIGDFPEVARIAKLRLPEQAVREEHAVARLCPCRDVPRRPAKIVLPALRRADEVLRPQLQYER